MREAPKQGNYRDPDYEVLKYILVQLFYRSDWTVVQLEVFHLDNNVHL